MSSISISRRRISEKDDVAVFDVDSRMRSWGRRGIFAGGIFGLTLGAIFVANPLTESALTFGTIGTLIVCAIECAVVAGGLCGLGAALYGQSVLLGGTTELKRAFATGNPPQGDIQRTRIAGR